VAKVYPFRSLRYAAGRIPIEKVVTQPYDKISSEMRDRYYALHPNNIVRIIFGKSTPADSPVNNVYTRAAAYLGQWRAAGVLEQLAEPAFFVCFQKYVVPGSGEVRLRKGFVGLGQLEDYSRKIVFPHERTLAGPKQDRLELLRHTRTHFEQIFMLYEDPARRIDALLDDVSRQEPDRRLVDEYGVEHTMWTMTSPEQIRFVQSEMADKTLVIADGHHRYETGLAYRDEMRGEKGSDRIPMAFFNMSAPGLTILPTHRVLRNVPAFDPDVFFRCAADFFDESSGEGVTIAVFTAGRFRMLRLKPELDLAALMPGLSDKQRTLDVVILHRLLLEKCLGITEQAVTQQHYVTYVRERDAAVEAVRSATAQVAFLLNPTRLDQIRDIAYEGNVLPQKSTDFYPKVLSGLMMYVTE
jgi:uncharacterized protein (DUF1015 family)